MLINILAMKILKSRLKHELRDDDVTVFMRIDNRTHASNIEQHVSDFSPSLANIITLLPFFSLC